MNSGTYACLEPSRGNASAAGWRKALAATSLAIVLFAPTHAAAQYWKFEKHEVAPLPPYCFARMLRNSPEDWEYWQRVMGKTYEHIHHYCRGLIYTNRLLFNQARKQDREPFLRQSLAEFDYVIVRSPRTFVLLPEILTKKGENALRLPDRIGEGLQALQDAIEIKPDYWPPYAALSDHYKTVGDLRKARDLLDKALSFAPETPALKNRLAALDGRSAPQPPPPPAKPKPPAAKPSAEQTEQSAPSNEPPADRKP